MVSTATDAGGGNGGSDGGAPPKPPPRPTATGGEPDESGGGGRGRLGVLVPRFLQPLLRRIAELRSLSADVAAQTLMLLDTWWIRGLRWLALVLAAVTGLLNLLLVPLVNAKLLPGWLAAVSRLLGRDVHVAGIRYVSLAGACADAAVEAWRRGRGVVTVVRVE